MAKLLAHPNNVIRQAVVQAMSVAEVEVAVTPKEESVQDKIGKTRKNRENCYVMLFCWMFSAQLVFQSR